MHTPKMAPQTHMPASGDSLQAPAAPQKSVERLSRTGEPVRFDAMDSLLLKGSAFEASVRSPFRHTPLKELSTTGLRWLSDANTASRGGRPIPAVPLAVAHELVAAADLFAAPKVCEIGMRTIEEHLCADNVVDFWRRANAQIASRDAMVELAMEWAMRHFAEVRVTRSWSALRDDPGLYEAFAHAALRHLQAHVQGPPDAWKQLPYAWKQELQRHAGWGPYEDALVWLLGEMGVAETSSLLCIPASPKEAAAANLPLLTEWYIAALKGAWESTSPWPLVRDLGLNPDETLKECLTHCRGRKVTGILFDSIYGALSEPAKARWAEYDAIDHVEQAIDQGDSESFGKIWPLMDPVRRESWLLGHEPYRRTPLVIALCCSNTGALRIILKDVQPEQVQALLHSSDGLQALSACDDEAFATIFPRSEDGQPHALLRKLSLEIKLKWLMAYDAPRVTQRLLNSFSSDPTGEEDAWAFVKHADFDVIKRLVRAGATNALRSALEVCLRFAPSERERLGAAVFDSEALALSEAARFGHLDVLKVMFDTFPDRVALAKEGNRYELLGMALRARQRDVVEFLCEEQGYLERAVDPASGIEATKLASHLANDKIGLLDRVLAAMPDAQRRRAFLVQNAAALACSADPRWPRVQREDLDEGNLQRLLGAAHQVGAYDAMLVADECAVPAFLAHFPTAFSALLDTIPHATLRDVLIARQAFALRALAVGNQAALLRKAFALLGDASAHEVVFSSRFSLLSTAIYHRHTETVECLLDVLEPGDPTAFLTDCRARVFQIRRCDASALALFARLLRQTKPEQVTAQTVSNAAWTGNVALLKHFAEIFLDGVPPDEAERRYTELLAALLGDLESAAERGDAALCGTMMSLVNANPAACEVHAEGVTNALRAAHQGGHEGAVQTLIEQAPAPLRQSLDALARDLSAQVWSLDTVIARLETRVTATHEELQTMSQKAWQGLQRVDKSEIEPWVIRDLFLIAEDLALRTEIYQRHRTTLEWSMREGDVLVIDAVAQLSKETVEELARRPVHDVLVEYASLRLRPPSPRSSR